MKKHLFAILAAAALSVPAFSAEETRTIRLIQDDAHEKMATKIYSLKHLKASDIGSFVDMAVRRYFAKSQVRALNFSANKQQSLIVTTPERFIPYVDQLVSTLDRGTKKNEYNSAVYGSGFQWKVYYPTYRTAEELMMYPDVMLSGNGNVYAQNGTLWVKDDMDDVDYALDWVKYFDRPVPQATLTFRYYEVRESTLRDVGVDYLAWKNGPGLNLVDVAFNSGRIAWDKVFNTAANVGGAMSWAYGGVFTAPAFDLSFIRLLQQSGEAKIAATATITVVNAQELATATLSPALNNQTKDDNFASHVVASEIPSDLSISIGKPTICFFPEASEVGEMGWIPASKEFYAKNKGSLSFSYSIASSDAVEANNLGAQVGNYFASASSKKTINFGREQLLAQSTREHDVEQTTGVPFLCQLPVLKYIFGTTTTMKEKTHIFVTMEAKLVHPEMAAAAK